MDNKLSIFLLSINITMALVGTAMITTIVGRKKVKSVSDAILELLWWFMVIFMNVTASVMTVVE